MAAECRVDILGNIQEWKQEKWITNDVCNFRRNRIIYIDF